MTVSPIEGEREREAMSCGDDDQLVVVVVVVMECKRVSAKCVQNQHCKQICYFIHQPHPSTSAACTINIGTAAAKVVVEREYYLVTGGWLASNLFIHHHHQSCRMFAVVSSQSCWQFHHYHLTNCPSTSKHMKKHSQSHLCIPLVLLPTCHCCNL